jgi:hypothetical protein
MDAVRIQEVPAASLQGSVSETTGSPETPERPTPEATAEGPGVARRLARELGGASPSTVFDQVSNDEILEAVNQDLFQPDRTPPLERYRLPSEREAPAQNRDSRRRREPNLRIVGTAIAGDLALALVQPEDSIPFTVLLGETVDGYLLAAIAEEAVTLTRDGDEFIYPVVEPQQSRSSNNRDRNARNRASTEEAARALTERVQQMLQGMQRGQMMRGGVTLQGREIPIQFVPGVAIERLPGGRTSATIVRPRGGGGGGGGDLP